MRNLVWVAIQCYVKVIKGVVSPICILISNYRIRRYHFSETLNILVEDIILEAMDQKSVTALILLDLSKAFDSVHHPTLEHLPR